MWDIYNIGTAVLKPENKVDLQSIIPAISIWGSFLHDNYCKITEEDEPEARDLPPSDADDTPNTLEEDDKDGRNVEPAG